MANSIFLGPQYSGTNADTLRQIEEKLNSDFSTFFAANPAIASQRQVLKMTYSSSDGQPDPIAVTQSKINANLALLNAASGLSIAPVALNTTREQTAGLGRADAAQLTTALAAYGAITALAALGLSTTAVTRTVAFTANVTGATVGSTLGATGLPTGLTLNGPIRTLTGTTSVTAGSYPIVITETLAGYWGSPRTNNFTLVVS